MTKEQEAKDWAEKTLKTDEIKEQLKEYLLFGSLLFAQNEKGERVWLKRITGDENFEIKPVSVLNGQIVYEK